LAAKGTQAEKKGGRVIILPQKRKKKSGPIEGLLRKGKPSLHRSKGVHRTE